MNVAATLSNGSSVIAYATPPFSNEISFEILDSSLSPSSGPTSVATGQYGIATGTAAWLGLEADAGGGFTVMWENSQHTLVGEDFSASGQPLTGVRFVGSTEARASQAFTTDATLIDGPDEFALLSDNGEARLWTYSGGFAVDKSFAYDPTQQTQYGRTFSDASTSLMPALTGAYGAGGGYDVAYAKQVNQSIELDAVQFSSNGQVFTQTKVVSYAASTQQNIDHVLVSGLASGGFVVLWGVQGPGQAADHLYLQEFNGNGQAVGSQQSVGQGTPERIEALPDGRYVVSWTDPTAASPATAEHHAAYSTISPISFRVTDPPPPGQTDTPPSNPPPPTGETLVASGSAVTLSASTGFTGAAVLTNHALAVAELQPSGAAEQSYDASGSQTASAALIDGTAPQVTALDGGYYEVTYAGSPDFDIYNGADQRVFVSNAFSDHRQSFTPLLNGGFVQTYGIGTFALGDANGNVRYVQPHYYASQTTEVHGLDGGGFVFFDLPNHEFQLYDSSGGFLEVGNLGASTSSYASAFAPLAGTGNGFAEAWLSAQGGQGGAPTSLDLQLEGPAGQITGVLSVAQDLDPYHTQIKLQAHDDQSVAVLWSQGGATFGAEYANGAVGAVHSSGLAENLSDMQVIQLSGDTVGFAFLQGGDAWAEIFDPASGQVQRQDLGAATGDLSSVHALATANGGMAVSWHNASGVVGAVLGASGQLGSAMALPGDLLGVDSNGHAVTLHDTGGAPVLQAFTLSDTTFWMH